jgi:iron complex outermembrane recepter protein
MCPAIRSGRRVGLVEPQVLHWLRLANGGDEMIRGTFASFALGAAFFSQGGLAYADPSLFDGIIFAQATPEAQPAPAQPSPTEGQQPTTPTAPKKPGITQLPPVKVTPEAAAPKAQAKPRVTEKPRRREAPLVRQAQPAARRVMAPAPQVPAESAAESAEAAALADLAQGVPMSPVQGSEIPLDKVPAAVGQVTSGEIARTGSPAIEEAIQQQVPGAIVTDTNGNQFSTSVEFRGFTASPIEGVPQGLAVYQNGVRINEVFGDTVNWDLIPTTAINNIAVVTGNPLYGLNALGGAVNITMKDGFGFQGVESDTRVGSYGRFQEYLQLGKQVDNFAAYAALEGIWDQGWRYYSPSEVRRAYADLGVKGKDSEFHINFTGATNAIGVVGPTPVELLGPDYSAVFTSPQTTNNELAMVSVNGSTKVTDTMNVAGVGYYRSYHQKHVDGNITDAEPCEGEENEGLLCLQTVNGTQQPLRDQFGRTITISDHWRPNDVIGEIDRTTNDANSFGGSLQATSKDRLFGLNNIFIGGASIDHGDVRTTSSAELGTINTSNWVVAGNGLFISSPLELAPLDLKITTNYYGLYFWDSLDIAPGLTTSVGGRYNYEEIDLRDQLNLPGSNLTGNHIYTRFNPTAGLTYKVNPNISLYAGYSEANRAPTPAELSCADPAQPCLLQSFLVSDPELQQVVSKTWQGGFRGAFSPFGYGTLNWTAGLFHTANFNDIYLVTSPVIVTRGYFTNAGETLRQGVEAGARYKVEGLTVYANYAYVDATFQSNLTLPSPNNPFADDEGNILVHPGDHLPTIPPHRVKMGFDYALTDAWSVGADVVLASSQYFFGDESNQNPQLPGYGVVNLRTSYEFQKGVVAYVLVNNIFDHKYATYGTFFETEILNASGTQAVEFNNPATITPAQPLSVYGGMKVRF